MQSRPQPPAPEYLGPARFVGGRQELNPLRRIVIHCTVSPCERGGARNVARYFRDSVTRPSSAHYIVDPGEVVQVVGDHTVAFHAPPNTDTIGVELCDMQGGPIARWEDANHRAMLQRAAELVAELCLAYDVPRRRLGHLRLRAGQRGITGHVDVSRAWGQTNHSDPGDGFPWATFMNLVRAEVRGCA